MSQVSTFVYSGICSSGYSLKVVFLFYRHYFHMLDFKKLLKRNRIPKTVESATAIEIRKRQYLWQDVVAKKMKTAVLYLQDTRRPRKSRASGARAHRLIVMRCYDG